MAGSRRWVSRRNFLRATAAGGAAATLGWAGHAQDPATPPTADTGAEFITEATETAIKGGLEYLARVQQLDGSFADRFTGSSVGVTALAGLALMAAGHQPGRGAFGRVVSRAVDYVVASGNGPTRGFLTSLESQAPHRNQNVHMSAMYSHGFGCLFLSEVAGMFPDRARQDRVKATLEKAIAFAVNAQNIHGGWRYEPKPPLADVSVTVAIMMAFRAAKHAGIAVKKKVIDDGVRFIKECQTPDGGFGYIRRNEGPSNAQRSAFARSAAAIVGLYSAGIYEGEEVEKGLKYVQQFLPGRPYSFQEIPPQHYYYGQYYAALAMWTAGSAYWKPWFPAIRDELLDTTPNRTHKGNNGEWLDSFNGSAYATAMSLIILQLPNNYLPILQK